MTPAKHSPNAAFTLLELTVSISVLALLIGAILGAFSMKRNYEVVSVMDKMGKLTQATIKFKDIYGGLPGDLWNAADKFGVGTTANGDGGGWIDTEAEATNVPYHLMLAGLIEGTYTGANWGSDNMLKGPLMGGAYYFASNSSFIPPTLYFANINKLTTGVAGGFQGGILTAQEMSKIDTKYDDGIYSTGKIIGREGAETGHVANSCITAATPKYNLASNANGCYFSLVIEDKF
jgi:hypothetical protein